MNFRQPKFGARRPRIKFHCRASHALALCVGLALLAGCGGDQPASTDSSGAAATPPAVAVETGGMALGGAAAAGGTQAGAAATDVTAAPDTTTGAGETENAAANAGGTPGAQAGSDGVPGGGESAAETAAEGEAEPVDEPPAVPVLAAGASITVSETAAVFAEPWAGALRYAVYPGDTAFIVVEPGGDFVAYPVEADGVRWYRVRAPDGLVGWLVASLPAE